MSGGTELKAQNVAMLRGIWSHSRSNQKPGLNGCPSQRRVGKAQADGLRRYLLTSMRVAGIQKIECPFFKLTVQRQPCEIFRQSWSPLISCASPNLRRLRLTSRNQAALQSGADVQRPPDSRRSSRNQVTSSRAMRPGLLHPPPLLFPWACIFFTNNPKKAHVRKQASPQSHPDRMQGREPSAPRKMPSGFLRCRPHWRGEGRALNSAGEAIPTGSALKCSASCRSATDWRKQPTISIAPCLRRKWPAALKKTPIA